MSDDVHQRAAEVIRYPVKWFDGEPVEWVVDVQTAHSQVANLDAANLLADPDTARQRRLGERLNADGMTIEEVLYSNRDSIAGHDAGACVRDLAEGGWLLDDAAARLVDIGRRALEFTYDGDGVWRRNGETYSGDADAVLGRIVDGEIER